ncbi:MULTISPECIES: hypothetical protein [unclassified Chelatococcus]|uniref:hypothetical protein n=1 Tax=unclassified Chelatococcus TaxID=2638111 RepID=UPI001BCC84F3|nr:MULTISPECIES: hypothetical protein [unclassified Chelatococcus]MBS7700518.1 hypothetical protein [Chelatococcus sp. YT9]MBX3556314.1 hypothetical protein [Chelatococcus sp.]
MSDVNPVRTLCSNLEAARIDAVVKAASAETLTTADIENLHKIQVALMAVRETLDEHSARLGWGSDEGNLEDAALAHRSKS